MPALTWPFGYLFVWLVNILMKRGHNPSKRIEIQPRYLICTEISDCLSHSGCMMNDYSRPTAQTRGKPELQPAKLL